LYICLEEETEKGVKWQMRRRERRVWEFEALGEEKEEFGSLEPWEKREMYGIHEEKKKRSGRRQNMSNILLKLGE